MPQKTPYCPPDPFVDDFDPTQGEMNAQTQDKRILPYVSAAANAIKKDFAEIADDAHGRRLLVASHLESMKDAHVVIRKIYALFPGREQLCAIPLGRQQIEHLFIVIGLLRKGDEFFLKHKKATVANAYKYFFYLSEETKNLGRFAEGNAVQMDEFHRVMREEMPSFTPDEIKSLEDCVLVGARTKDSLRPTGVKGVIKEVSAVDHDELLVKILCRVYVEYERLCAFTHSDLSSQTAHAFLGGAAAHVCTGHLRRTVTCDYILWVSYITMLTAVTEASLHVKNPVALRAALCDLWGPFEEGHLLGRFVWRNWARNAMGILDA